MAAPAQMSGPSLLTPSAKSFEGLASWISSPVMTVGATNAPVDSAPSGIDSASKSLCKTQSYTSWDCYSRSYVGSLHIERAAAQDHPPVQANAQGPDPMQPDVPTPEEMAVFTTTERRKLESKKYHFYRGVGLLSRKQSLSQRYKGLLLERFAPKGAAGASGATGLTLPVGVGLDSNPNHRTSPQTTPGESEHAHQSGPTPSPVDGQQNTAGGGGSETPDYDDLQMEREQGVKRKVPSGKAPKAYNTRSVKNGPSQGTPQVPEHAETSDGDDGAGGPVLQQTSSKRPNPEHDIPPNRDPSPNPRRRAAQPGAGPMIWEVYSDTLPVRVFNVTTVKTQREHGMPIPYSPTYTAFTQRLSDPANTGALGSVVRGPSVRDATSYASLCKYLSKDTGTYYEMAPIVRLACISCSICPNNYSTEVITRRFIRDFTPIPNQFTRPRIVPPPAGPYHLSAVAMPLDIFLAWTLGKLNPVVDPANADFRGFVPTRIDEYWTAVPMRAEMTTRRDAIPYIGSFLHSALWNGRVSWSIAGTTDDNDRTPANRRDVTYTCMPTTSSVFIPGSKNIIIVLVDSTAQYSSQFVRLWGGQNVPVYTGQTLAGANLPIDILATWNAWFSNDNIDNIVDDCNHAFNEVNNRLSVENNTELSLSLAAEVYAALYNGVAVPTAANAPVYEWGEDAFGAWKLSAHEPLCRGSRLMCARFSYENPDEHVAARRRTVGYNFSSLTALHRAPSGVSRTRAHTFEGERIPHRVWRGRYPDEEVSTYNITTMDSLYRVGVYVGLVLTHERQLMFPHSAALAGWVHMLAGAISCQTAMSFAQNNVSLPVWSGFDDRFDGVFSQDWIIRLLDTYTQGIVRYTSIPDIANSWEDWDEDAIVEYYGLDPFNNDNWLSYSPVPYHLLVQWINKMDHHYGTAPPTICTFRHNFVNHQGLRLDDKSGEYRAHTVCTIDADRYFPLVVFRQVDALNHHMLAWIDNWSYISVESSGGRTVTNKTYLESQTFVLTPVCAGLSFTADTELYVINSAYTGITPEYRAVRASSILYPDPPSMQTIIDGAKNYLLYPALSALAGYATGGPAGAVVAGGSTLAKNLAEGFLAPSTAQGVTKVVDAAAKEAKAQFVPPTPQTPVINVHTATTHDAKAVPDMIPPTPGIENTEVVADRENLPVE